MREFRRATTDLQDEFKKSASEPNRDSVPPTEKPASDVKSTTDTKA
jgi:Sec-independent protein translocase protein TatA